MDETSTTAWGQLAEFQVLLDLTMERLADLQRDFAVLQAEMVKCHAMLPTLAVPVEPAGDTIWTDQPAGADIWGPG